MVKNKIVNSQIIFEDETILVVNKNSGVVVNRSATADGLTLQDELSEYFSLKKGSLGIGDRAGIVHRLDKETSGVLVVAKTMNAFGKLQKQFKERIVSKKYIALVHGEVKEEKGFADADIGRIGKFGKFGVVKEGREARTDFELVKKYNLEGKKLEELIDERGFVKSRINYLKRHAIKYSLLDVFPKSGRTHQIRVHLKSLGFPVVSDLIYCPGKLVKLDLIWCPRLFLHAEEIEFIHPKTKKTVKFKADLQKDLKLALSNLTINR